MDVEPYAHSWLFQHCDILPMWQLVMDIVAYKYKSFEIIWGPCKFFIQLSEKENVCIQL